MVTVTFPITSPTKTRNSPDNSFKILNFFVIFFNQIWRWGLAQPLERALDSPQTPLDAYRLSRSAPFPVNLLLPDISSLIAQSLLIMSSPAKEDLPKVPTDFKNELEKFDAAKMKHTETKEKNPLPSKEDLIQEKQRHEIFTGVSTFNKAKLKRTNTKEKIVLPTKEVIEQEKGSKAILQGIESFDPSKLKPTETQEKNPLPTKEVIDQEKSGAA
ncbi:hypothetical protein AVEN_63455-1 [Araneus ventricosus]|uniref:Thymosin beta n=1 Tax=Araneus ventricosus TaxID=182803 RepID=A0A4Y2CT86_ARAVE|nr:hypothetical protein AVEN_63455-1 [Araneus ventricosus]